jgi:glutamate racemase
VEPTLGVFDSGLGGLSVLRAVREQLPGAAVLYFGDNGHIPYGARPLAQVRAFSHAITRFLVARGAQVMVVACNTASAAALVSLRQAPEFAGLPFVGMEPAIKPAAQTTRSGVVGVLATPATFQGELYASVVERFAQGVTVLQQVCPGLVQQIEAGQVDTPATEAMLRGWLAPMLAQGIDALVLGCTHYAFLIPTLERICGPGVAVIDPAPAVARQVARVCEPLGAEGHGHERARLDYFTSGSPAAFAAALATLGIERGPITPVEWIDDDLVETPRPAHSLLGWGVSR